MRLQNVPDCGAATPVTTHEGCRCTAHELPDDSEKVNPNGGAIALGHPLGMSGARLALTAARELQRAKTKRALVTMCIGVGQGMAMVIERV